MNEALHEFKQQLEVAERLRQRIQDCNFCTEQGVPVPLPLRVSIGVAERQSENESISELMSRADKALYRAKAEGRNKVVEAERKLFFYCAFLSSQRLASVFMMVAAIQTASSGANRRAPSW